jgi:hypothetical protein
MDFGSVLNKFDSFYSASSARLIFARSAYYVLELYLGNMHACIGGYGLLGQQPLEPSQDGTTFAFARRIY